MKNIILFILILLVGGALFYLATRTGLLNKTPSRLEIISTPAARVSLNDQEVGMTPYEDKALKADTYTIRLSPEDASLGLSPYETTLQMGKGDSAVINHTFAAAAPDTVGYTLELKKEAGQDSFISVVTDPDTANITLDGSPEGYSPLSRLEVTPGSHTLLLSSPGYKPLSISVNTAAGHNLIVKAKLAIDTIQLSSPPPASESASPNPSPSPSPTASASPRVSPTPVMTKPYVLIEETGTGWLRVRSEPTATGEELGQADVGAKLKYLGETTEDGWHQVQFEGQTGWVSGRYASVVR